MDENEQRLLDSWNNNASSWTRVIRHQQIESRVLVTNSAILETVIELKPKTFLDVGCGEGWLCRELFSKGIDGWGVDASAELIEAARQEGDTRFLVSLYSDLTSHKFGDTVHFSCLICNFSILGKHDLADIASTGLCLLAGLKQKSTPNKAQSSFIRDEYVPIWVQPLDKTERHCCPKRL
jgi:SAM-dependent methyltransferase